MNPHPRRGLPGRLRNIIILFKRDKRGYLVFGFDTVRSVRDVIVVSTA